MRLFGLKNCDACRKAMKALEAAGRGVEFVDIRKEATGDDIARWLERSGAGALTNRRSTTWRGLDEGERAAADGPGALALLTTNPALIKRPVIETSEALFIGWSDDARAALL
nr:ArsC/Spx/MgsR family protein [Pikeienuella piscinae]